MVYLMAYLLLQSPLDFAPLFLSNVWLGIRTIYKPRRLLPRVSESVALLNSLPNVVH